MYNDKIQRSRRQGLRKNQTEAESFLWQKLRNRQFNNLKFCRQYSIGPYTVDFFCPEIRLAVELDGEQHKDAIEYDRERGNFLKDKDINVLRFWNEEILRDAESVLNKIHNYKNNPLNPPYNKGEIR